MIELTHDQLQRIRHHFGDLVYEHPELHPMMLEIIEQMDDTGN
ncbi:hypothetical protein [Ensifer aridi]|nr:hypothetical protein [Ensifer aridi]